MKTLLTFKKYSQSKQKIHETFLLLSLVYCPALRFPTKGVKMSGGFYVKFQTNLGKGLVAVEFC